jgi:predicted O-linked N-acetylglucosamine transferase (SPINDLY family)
MGRPYIAMTSFLPWSRRPAALLDMAGLGDWLAATPENYLELARRPPPGPDPSLREKMIAAGLTDERAFALGFATAMKTMFTENIREVLP